MRSVLVVLGVALVLMSATSLARAQEGGDEEEGEEIEEVEEVDAGAEAAAAGGRPQRSKAEEELNNQFIAFLLERSSPACREEITGILQQTHSKPTAECNAEIEQLAGVFRQQKGLAGGPEDAGEGAPQAQAAPKVADDSSTTTVLVVLFGLSLIAGLGAFGYVRAQAVRVPASLAPLRARSPTPVAFCGAAPCTNARSTPGRGRAAADTWSHPPLLRPCPSPPSLSTVRAPFLPSLRRRAPSIRRR